MAGPVGKAAIEILDKARHDRAGFRCGVVELDGYLHRQAAQDQERRAAVVYVATYSAPEVAGFYTLSQFTLELTDLPEGIAKRLARYPLVSATLIGRLAVAEQWQGRGLGRDLLFDALWRALGQSRFIASAGVVVDAKDAQAASFYRKYGFAAVLGTERRLFLAMRTVEGMF